MKNKELLDAVVSSKDNDFYNMEVKETKENKKENNIFEKYEKELVGYECLSLNKVKELINARSGLSKELQKEYTDKAFFGTLKGLLREIERSNIEYLNDMISIDEFITYIYGLWYEFIDNGNILEHVSINNAYRVVFVRFVKDFCGDYNHTLFNHEYFKSLLITYFNYRNNNIDVNYFIENYRELFIDEVFERFDSFYAYDDFTILIEVLENLYKFLSKDDTKEVNLSLTTINRIFRLLEEIGLYDNINTLGTSTGGIEEVDTRLLANSVFDEEKLNDENKYIISKLFGFEDDEILTKKEIAKQAKYSLTKLHFLERKAMRKLEIVRHHYL